jgi:hypothetical protein
VNALAIIYVNDHLETLHAEARRNRMASLAGRRSLRESLASVGAGLRRFLESGSSSSTVPQLRNYPYGG